MSRLIRQTEWFTVAMCRANPDRIYVFGDNMAHRGRAGQAVIRGESNAIGLPTKWYPARDEGAYFTDALFEDAYIRTEHFTVFAKLRRHLAEARTVVIPADGFGTGLAELPKRAPRMHAWIENQIRQL